MMLLAQFLIWFGAASLLLAVAALEIDHAATFFGFGRAMRSMLPIKVADEFNPELIEILEHVEPRR